MSENAVSVDILCGNTNIVDQRQDLLNTIRTLGQGISELNEELKASDPIQVPEQLQVPGIKLVKVGLTLNKLEHDLTGQLSLAEAVMRYSHEDLPVVASYVLKDFKKQTKAKKTIPNEIAKLCRDYQKSQINNDDFNQQISTFKLQQIQSKLEDLKTRMKKAYETHWQDTEELDDISNYTYNDPEFLGWLNAKGNYGVLSGPFKDGDEVLANLVLIDLDDYDRVAELGLLQGWPETFSVKTGRQSPAGRHLYYFVSSIPDGFKGKIKLYEGDHELGEIKLNASYCVGPNSLHPSGRRYEIVAPAEIAVLDWGTIQALADKCKMDGRQEIKRSASTAQERTAKNNSWEDQIRTEWILFPNPIVVDNRDGDGWVKGLSPIHPASQHGQQSLCQCHNQ